MDKSRMTFTFRPQQTETRNEVREFRKQRPFRYEDRARKPNKKLRATFTGGTWLMPALLASITGIALGIAVLFIFKTGTSDLKPSVTTVGSNYPPTAMNSSVQSLPGLQLIAYQVGVFTDQAKAKKGISEFEKIGVHPILRNSGQFQLFAGVALDKAQGQVVADQLKQTQVPYYAKDYVIAEKKGTIQGMTGKDATTLTSVLTQSLLLTKDGIRITTDSAQTDAIKSWSEKVQAVTGQVAMGRNILDKAGKKGELLRYNDLHQQLQEAANALVAGKAIFEVQNRLLQALVDYEELTAKLIP